MNGGQQQQREEEEEQIRPFPVVLENDLQTLLNAYTQHDHAFAANDRMMHALWSNLRLQKLDNIYELPPFPSAFSTISTFVQTELKVQAEMIRDELNKKVQRLLHQPKEDDKHLAFPFPRLLMNNNSILHLDFSDIFKVPSQGKFTNYVVLFQTVDWYSGTMQNLTLAYCTQLQRSGGGSFILGADASTAFSNLQPGETIFVRVLKSLNFLKTKFRALAALQNARNSLGTSCVAKQLLKGYIPREEMQTLDKLNQWVQSKLELSGNDSTIINLDDFNEQQQRALALEDLTKEGVVQIQGPPGTGKSHIICHGLLPQLVARGERVLVLCNSNVAVDALMRKCIKITTLVGGILRCGFKGSVSDDIVDLNLYAEGDKDSPFVDSYGNRSGTNSNTEDQQVQHQIRSKQIVFTTIHFASKEKGRNENNAYWNFDTMILDEAAQIEDSKLFIVLARCPSLKKIILVGDPKQIQPYVPDSVRRQGYGKSTMERMMENSDKELVACRSAARSVTTPYIMLNVQFRMAPSLRQVVSHLYYQDQLQDGDVVLQRGPIEGVKLKSLLVVNLTGATMTFNRLHQSYENLGEAMVVNVLLDFLMSSDFNGALPDDAETLAKEDICILTPFNRHKDRLRMTICRIDEKQLDAYSGQTFGDNKLGSPKKTDALYGTRTVEESLATMVQNIDTVDKFQGSERKIVIISTCVDKKPLRAADPHFINVACSRAQHLLVVVGNFSQGLSSNRDWAYIWNEAKQNGSAIDHSVSHSVPSRRPHDGSGLPNIHKESLKAKLQDLLERPSQRRR